MRRVALLAIALMVSIYGISQAQPAELDNNQRVTSRLSCVLDAAPGDPQQVGVSSDISSATCLMCGSGSSGSCARRKGKARVQCRGTRKECRARGCAISGTASCSSAGNVQSC